MEARPRVRRAAVADAMSVREASGVFGLRRGGGAVRKMLAHPVPQA